MLLIFFNQTRRHLVKKTHQTARQKQQVRVHPETLKVSDMEVLIEQHRHAYYTTLERSQIPAHEVKLERRKISGGDAVSEMRVEPHSAPTAQ